MRTSTALRSTWLELRTTRSLLAKLLGLAAGPLTWTALTWAALSKSTLTRSTLSRSALSRTTLLALLELWATLARAAELLRLARLSWATLLAGAALTTLLPGLSSWTAWAFVERLGALLGLSLTALWTSGLAARLALVVLLVVLLLALVLGVFALCNDQTAICSTHALERDAQLRNRNRRDQGAGEQDVAKLLQLPDRFEWQGALLRFFERRITSMRGCRPDPWHHLGPHCGRTLVRKLNGFR